MIKQPTQFTYGHEGLTVMYTIPKYYKDALRATLETLQPRKCLEIGTYAYGTAEVFQDYFSNNLHTDNQLVTCDIIPWANHPPRLVNVDFIQVYPHFPDQYMQENNYRMLAGWKSAFPQSIELNMSLIYDVCPHQFDFIFIDADHRAVCLGKDLEMANRLKIKHVLLEDVAKEELIQESSTYYHQVVKPTNIYDCYDFDDWTVLTNCALLTRRG